MRVSLGIDFGTHFFRMAHLVNGKPVAVGARMPIARTLGVSDDSNNAIALRARITDSVPVQFFHERVTFAELATRAFAYLRNTAEQELHETVAGCVVSVPALAGNEFRQPLTEIIRAAGFYPVRLMSAPVLALLGHAPPLNAEPPTLVVCVGASALEAMLVRHEQGRLIELEKGARESVSGCHFTNCLYDPWVHRLPPPQHNDEKILRQVESEAERVKLALSTAEEASVRLPGVKPFAIRRAEFEALIQVQVREGIALCDELLARAKLTQSDLGQVLLVGGSLAIPLVRNEFSRWYGRAPIFANEYSVALGAALLCKELDLSTPPPEPPKRLQPAVAPAALPSPKLAAQETMIVQYLREADTAAHNQNYAGAFDALKYLAKLVDHQQAAIYFLRAQSHEQAGKNEDALKDYEQAIKLHDTPEYRHACAALLLHLADHEISRMNNLLKQGQKGDANRRRKDALARVQLALKYVPHDPILHRYEKVLKSSKG